MALYDGDFSRGLLAEHIRACRAGIPETAETSDVVRAFKVFFAAGELEISEGMTWPDWCTDRPVPGTFIGAGQPVCTVCAEGSDRSEVERSIELRLRELRERLYAVRS